MKLLRDLVVLRVAPDRAELVEASEAELAALRALAARAEPARLRRMFRALVREQEDLAWAPEPFAVLEMALVRLATLAAGDDVGRAPRAARRARAAARGEGGDGRPARAAARGRGARAAPRGRPEPAPRPAAPRRPRRPRRARAAPPTRPSRPRPPPRRPRGRGRRRAAPEAEPASSLRDAAGAGAPLEPSSTACASSRSARTAASSRRSRAGARSHWDGERLRARRAEPGIAARRLVERRADLAAVCERFFGRPVRVELEIEGDPTPAAQGARAGVEGGRGGAPPRGAEPPRGERRARDPRRRDPRDPPARGAGVSQPDLGELLAQAQEMQGRLADLQRRLALRTVEASAGGGMVTAVATGALRIRELRIEPALLAAGDREMLQDLTAAAVNAALAAAERMVQEEMQRATGLRSRAAHAGPLRRGLLAARRAPDREPAPAARHRREVGHAARLLPALGARGRWSRSSRTRSRA